MKTKIMAIMLVGMCAIGLCGCNQNIGIGNYSYKHAHFSDGTSGYCVTVTSWHDDDMGCEIHTPTGDLFLSEGTYILFSDAEECPYCD